MIHIDCLFSPAPRQVVHIRLSLPEGSTVKDALAAVHATSEWNAYLGTFQHPPEMLAKQGIWGRMAHPHQLLKDGDRLEIYRALQVDPKLARKQRFKRQGKGRTGLFARRRAGAVAGY